MNSIHYDIQAENHIAKKAQQKAGRVYSLSTHTLAHCFLSRTPHTERASDWTAKSELPIRA